MTDIDRDLTGDPLTVTCNYCGAPIGTPCRTRGSGRPRAAVHNDRPAKAAAVAFMRSLGHDAPRPARHRAGRTNRRSTEMMQPPTGAQRPKPDPTQGARPAEPEAPQLSRSDIARMSPAEIVAAQEAGQLNDLMSGRSA